MNEKQAEQIIDALEVIMITLNASLAIQGLDSRTESDKIPESMRISADAVGEYRRKYAAPKKPQPLFRSKKSED